MLEWILNSNDLSLIESPNYTMQPATNFTLLNIGIAQNRGSSLHPRSSNSSNHVMMTKIDGNIPRMEQSCREDCATFLHCGHL